MARTKTLGIELNKDQELHVRIEDNGDLRLRMGNKGRYVTHANYTNLFCALQRARKLSRKCKGLVVKYYAAYGSDYVPERSW